MKIPLITCVTFASLAMISPLRAAEWDGTTGLYREGSNWDGDVVPDGEDAIILNGGTAEVVAGDFLIPIGLFIGGHAGSGSLTQSGGEFAVTQLSVGGDDVSGGTGVGVYTMSGGSLTAGNTEMWIGSRGGTGTLNMSGDAHITAVRQIHFGRDGSVGTGDIAGNAVLENTSSIITVGIASPGMTSTLTVRENATVSSADEFYVGWLGDNTTQGVLNIQDTATVNVVRGMVIGRDNGTGTLNVSGSSELVIGGGLMAGAGGVATGTITVNDSATVTALWIAVPLNEDSSGSMIINGGTVKATSTTPTGNGEEGIIINASGSATSRTLTLNGGVLEVNSFRKGRGDQVVDVNFNGGTVRAIQDTTEFFAPGTGEYVGSSGFTSADFDVQAGGLAFDTNGFAVTITQGLNGVGGVIKLGEGTLTLSGISAYLGGTVVDNGTLTINSGFLADGANVVLNGDAVFDLAFTGTDTIGALLFNGIVQATGTWGAIDSGADHESAVFTGTGILNVTSAVPEPSAMALLCGGFGFAVWSLRKRMQRS